MAGKLNNIFFLDNEEDESSQSGLFEDDRYNKSMEYAWEEYLLPKIAEHALQEYADVANGSDIIGVGQFAKDAAELLHDTVAGKSDAQQVADLLEDGLFLGMSLAFPQHQILIAGVGLGHHLLKTYGVYDWVEDRAIEFGNMLGEGIQLQAEQDLIFALAAVDAINTITSGISDQWNALSQGVQQYITANKEQTWEDIKQQEVQKGLEIGYTIEEIYRDFPLLVPDNGWLGKKSVNYKPEFTSTVLRKSGDTSKPELSYSPNTGYGPAAGKNTQYNINGPFIVQEEADMEKMVRSLSAQLLNAFKLNKKEAR